MSLTTPGKTLASMRIGITGGRGVLGRVMQSQLTTAGADCSLFPGDICRLEDLQEWLALADFDAVFHFAAVVPTQMVNDQPAHALRVNVGGTINLVAAIANLPGKPWLFYASSSHVYQPQPWPLREADPVAPFNVYGLSKRMGEEVIEMSASAAGISFCIGRIFSFYHPTQTGSFLYPAIQRRFASEDLTQPFRLAGADDVRDISPADELVTCILQLAHRGATGIVNIGSGRGTRIADFVQSIAPCELAIINDTPGPSTSLIADVTRLRQLLTS